MGARASSVCVCVCTCGCACVCVMKSWGWLSAMQLEAIIEPITFCLLLSFALSLFLAFCLSVILFISLRSLLPFSLSDFNYAESASLFSPSLLRHSLPLRLVPALIYPCIKWYESLLPNGLPFRQPLHLRVNRDWAPVMRPVLQQSRSIAGWKTQLKNDIDIFFPVPVFSCA